MQIIYLIKDLYLEYTKSSCNLITETPKKKNPTGQKMGNGSK